MGTRSSSLWHIWNGKSHIVLLPFQYSHVLLDLWQRQVGDIVLISHTLFGFLTTQRLIEPPVLFSKALETHGYVHLIVAEKSIIRCVSARSFVLQAQFSLCTLKCPYYGHTVGSCTSCTILMSLPNLCCIHRLSGPGKIRGSALDITSKGK